jgi:predicted nucleic acid-binding protein
VIVVDASAAVLGLLNDGDARALLATETLAVPHLIDAEIVNALRSQIQRSAVDVADARRALDVWARLGLQRVGIVGLLPRVWELRDNLTACDATYVAVTETLDCALLTADARLAGAPGIRCEISLVQR